jgi:thiol:disulfide interchange protein DsbA
MQLIKKLLVALLIGLISFAAFASITNPENGKEYQVLAQPQQTDAPAGKIEVTEFFFYSCPHCNKLDPFITEWVKKQGNAISFKRVHVDFGQGQQPLQRMYYTLEAMGKLDELHARIFKAIHQDRQILRTDADMLDFVTKNGVDKMKYLEISHSFGIESKMRRAKSLQDAYKIEGVPTLFVDGHYMTSPSTLMGINPGMDEVGGAKAALQVMDVLVLKAQKDHAITK